MRHILILLLAIASITASGCASRRDPRSEQLTNTVLYAMNSSQETATIGMDLAKGFFQILEPRDRELIMKNVENLATSPTARDEVKRHAAKTIVDLKRLNELQ